MGALFLGFAMATNKTTGARSNMLATIAGFSRANFMFRVAMEKSAPYAAANYFLVIAPSMIVQTAHSLPQLS